MADQSDADPVAAALGWLRAHDVAVDVFGGPEHVSGLTEAPWPHLSVSNGTNGDLRGGVWSGEHEVELEVVGSPDGAPGKAALWRAAMKTIRALVDMPEQAYQSVTDPVVSFVRPTGVAIWAPMSNGQPRYITSVMVTIHPPVG